MDDMSSPKQLHPGPPVTSPPKSSCVVEIFQAGQCPGRKMVFKFENFEHRIKLKGFFFQASAPRPLLFWGVCMLLPLHPLPCLVQKPGIS